MRYRSQARELALQALCYFDINRGDPEELIELFCLNFEKTADKNISPFFLNLVNGVTESVVEIDSVIKKYSKNWRLSRMPVVDRNVLRIAAFELLKCSDIPSTVSINEAVEIGKKFGAKGTGSFVNGVLDRIRISEKIE
ncbi:MAG: transcription antitermination factor NusB [Thermodesulfobacteriota bacterium]|nr:transcription antitermination factor NusB [Thermodesulfobacteriota bacterium]